VRRWICRSLLSRPVALKKLSLKDILSCAISLQNAGSLELEEIDFEELFKS
jgi:hypothetical protein